MRIGTGGNIMPPAESLLRTSQSVERRGYDSLWWPDHLMGWHPQTVWTPDVTDLAAFQPNPHVYFDPVAAIAAVAVHTERVQLGTAVTEMVRRHPAMVAQEWLTLDHLSKGRVVLGVGAGERENIEPYGLDYSRPVSRFEESLAIVRLLWENDGPVDFDGEFWTFRDAVCGMAPYHADGDARRYPPIWAGAHGPRMLSIVGRLCDGWLPTYSDVDTWAAGRAAVRAAATEAGRDPDAIECGMWGLLVVDDDEEEVERICATPVIRAWLLVNPAWQFEALGYEHPLGPDWNGLTDYVPARLSRDEALAAIDRVPTEVVRRFLLTGTPDEVVAEVRRFAEAGLDHLVVQNVTFMGDLGKLRGSYQLQDEIAATLRS